MILVQQGQQVVVSYLDHVLDNLLKSKNVVVFFFLEK